MNEVSIIINGVRYDTVKANTEFTCEECDLCFVCEEKIFSPPCLIIGLYEAVCFKKSDKKFEK